MASSRNETRPVKLTLDVNPYALGSVIVEFGNTKVQVTAMVEESVPPFLKGKGQGWLTAEYAMLPASSQTRIPRDRKGISGRSQEIQRLIGRCLRAAIDLNQLGERSILIDCDVLVADGGTRTASITGGMVALKMCTERLMKKGLLLKDPIQTYLAAVSVGVSLEGNVLVDLNYEEDSQCAVDFNIIMTEKGDFVEVQGAAEGRPFTKKEHEAIMSAGEKAIQNLIQIQKKTLESLK